MKRINEWRENDNGSLTHVNEWRLTGWGEKALYVIGWIWLVMFVLGFLIGFIGAFSTT